VFQNVNVKDAKLLHFFSHTLVEIIRMAAGLHAVKNTIRRNPQTDMFFSNFFTTALATSTAKRIRLSKVPPH
jgi:hypothetical protein